MAQAGDHRDGQRAAPGPRTFAIKVRQILPAAPSLASTKASCQVLRLAATRPSTARQNSASTGLKRVSAAGRSWPQKPTLVRRSSMSARAELGTLVRQTRSRGFGPVEGVLRRASNSPVGSTAARVKTKAATPLRLGRMSGSGAQGGADCSRN